MTSLDSKWFKQEINNINLELDNTIKNPPPAGGSYAYAFGRMSYIASFATKQLEFYEGKSDGNS